MEQENIQKDIEAIEKEKQDFLEGKDVDSEEETETEVLEFSLMDEEIDELVTKLQLLKESKEQISFEIDDENELLINYENSEEE
jgi:hypothetical protein